MRSPEWQEKIDVGYKTQGYDYGGYDGSYVKSIVLTRGNLKICKSTHVSLLLNYPFIHNKLKKKSQKMRKSYSECGVDRNR